MVQCQICKQVTTRLPDGSVERCGHEDAKLCVPSDVGCRWIPVIYMPLRSADSENRALRRCAGLNFEVATRSMQQAPEREKQRAVQPQWKETETDISTRKYFQRLDGPAQREFLWQPFVRLDGCHVLIDPDGYTAECGITIALRTDGSAASTSLVNSAQRISIKVRQ